MYPPEDALRSMLRKKPELTAGPHMPHVASGVVALAKTDLRSARRVAAAVMRGSTHRNQHFEAAAAELLSSANDALSDGEFNAMLADYKAKPADASGGTVPDDFDLLVPELAFDAFIRAALDEYDGPKPMDAVTDELIAMSESDRKEFAEKIANGQAGSAYLTAAVPLGIL